MSYLALKLIFVVESLEVLLVISYEKSFFVLERNWMWKFLDKRVYLVNMMKVNGC